MEGKWWNIYSINKCASVLISDFVNINAKMILPSSSFFWDLVRWHLSLNFFQPHNLQSRLCSCVCVCLQSLYPCACTCCCDSALPWLGSPWQFLSLTSDVWAGRSWAHTHRTSAWDKQTGPPVLAFVQVTCAAEHASTCAQTHATTLFMCKHTRPGTHVLGSLVKDEAPAHLTNQNTHPHISEVSLDSLVYDRLNVSQRCFGCSLTKKKHWFHWTWVCTDSAHVPPQALFLALNMSFHDLKQH